MTKTETARLTAALRKEFHAGKRQLLDAQFAGAYRKTMARETMQEQMRLGRARMEDALERARMAGITLGYGI